MMKLVHLSNRMFRIEDKADEGCFTDLEIVDYDSETITVQVSKHLYDLTPAACDTYSIARFLLGAYEPIVTKFHVNSVRFRFNDKTYTLSAFETPLSVHENFKAVQ